MSSPTGTIPEKCRSCNASMDIPYVCQGCHTLYPASKPQDYFELLGLPRRYDIDPAEVTQRFLAISRHVHPDFFSAAAGEMQKLSVRLSADLNEAVRVLKDPVLRASYLLETSGGSSAAEDRTVPPEVLTETLMLREEIEEAKESGDAATLASLRDTVTQKRERIIDRIRSLAQRLATAADKERTELRHAINSVKYYSNMLDELYTD